MVKKELKILKIIFILNNDEDLRYFDKQFTEESILDINDTQSQNYTYYNEFTYFNIDI